MRRAAWLVALAFVAACGGKIAPGSELDPAAAAPASSAASGTSSGAAPGSDTTGSSFTSSSGSSGSTAKTPVNRVPVTATGNYDDGATHVHPSSSTVTIDGSPCAFDFKSPQDGLQLGFQRTGWTLAGESTECQLEINVSGFDDLPYPQTQLAYVDGLSSVVLYPTDHGPESGSDPNGSVMIQSGPVKGVAYTIQGNATVVAPGGATHTITFDIVL